MNRWIPGWVLLAGALACGVCGIATAAHNRRAGKMRRLMRRAGKMMSELSSAMLHLFS
ncbi:MAG: hypothetical protein IJW99_03425 [Clostridia bacterium]|nr:hypothetical protein [Clostridia bacterium]